MPKGQSSYWDVGKRQRNRRKRKLIVEQLARTDTNNETSRAQASASLEPFSVFDTSSADFGEIEVDFEQIASSVGGDLPPSIDKNVDFSFFEDPDEPDVFTHGSSFWGLNEDDEWRSIDEVFLTEEFSAKLRNICVGGTISKATLTEILKLLREEIPQLHNLPKDARTLLKTPKNTGAKIVPMDPGRFFHFSWKAALIRLFEESGIDPPDIIELSINADGLPLFKSPRSEFWPILASIFNVPQLLKNVIVISLYYGPKKPGDFDHFIKQMVDDCNDLFSNGLVINGKKVRCQVRVLPFDAPAKASVLGIKNFNAHSACIQCKCEGITVNHRTYFRGTQFEPRTHVGFIDQVDEDLHNRRSYIVNLKGVNLIDAVVTDFMHAVCLGVCKKLLGFWLVCPQGDKRFKLDAARITKISERLINITASKSNPSDFARPPRGLEEIQNWKATEYRTFLLYTGPAALKGVIKAEAYENFLLLHTAITILISPKYCFGENIDLAEKLLVRFVETFAQLYSEEFISYNVHSLLHLAKFCRMHGPLDKFSVWLYEDELGTIKKYINTGSQPLEQCVNRVTEKSFLPPVVVDPSSERNFKHSWPWSGVGGLPLVNADACPQYRAVECSKFRMRCGPLKDSFCGLEDGTVMMSESFVLDKDNLFIAGRLLQGRKSLYDRPFRSKHLGSHVFSKMSESVELRSVQEIVCKYYVFRVDSSFYAFPLQHSFLK
ncbi:uncharacterized protein [Bemisia tabaci]|uniref:uncharacterized protein isoform X1 n=1 Tax=Bemisia tabaci TaxID=7038 RepID=UPI003B28390E